MGWTHVTSLKHVKDKGFVFKWRMVEGQPLSFNRLSLVLGDFSIIKIQLGLGINVLVIFIILMSVVCQEPFESG